MTQVFDEEGKAFPVTLVEAGPCKVTQVKNKDKDGYDAVQIGFVPIKSSKIKKSQKARPYKHVHEVRGSFDVNVSDEITAENFTPGEKVKVRGISKGKGFAGVMKRWNFSGAGTSTHGTKHTDRKGGSIGAVFPQRVFKGTKMAGRMGADNVTVKNLQIIEIDTEKHVIVLRGALPGRKGGVLTIEKV